MRVSGLKLTYIPDFTHCTLPLISRRKDRLLTSANTSVGMQYETAPFDSTGQNQWKEQMQELQAPHISEGNYRERVVESRARI